MKLDDNYDYEFDYEDHSGRMNIGAMIIVVSVFILAILLIVVVINQNSGRKSTPAASFAEEETSEEMLDEFGYPTTSELVSESGLTPDDLDFWDMYPKDGEGTDLADPDVPNDAEKKLAEKEKKKEKEEDEDEEGDNLLDPDEKDPMDDGKHTLIEYSDGTKEWVVISPYLSKIGRAVV